jgi:hypothetical protein
MTDMHTRLQGAIGFAINGVAIYSDGDADGLDAYLNEGVSFDSCKAHVDQRWVSTCSFPHPLATHMSPV